MHKSVAVKINIHTDAEAAVGLRYGGRTHAPDHDRTQDIGKIFVKGILAAVLQDSPIKTAVVPKAEKHLL